MKTFGNILWLIFNGVILGILWGILGVVWCVTLIGIPFGLQCFKISRLVFWPFGRQVDKDFERHSFANFIWIVPFGLSATLFWGILGVVWCVTLIGIPFGLRCFKIAELAFMPFGAEVFKESDTFVVVEK